MSRARSIAVAVLATLASPGAAWAEDPVMTLEGAGAAFLINGGDIREVARLDNGMGPAVTFCLVAARAGQFGDFTERMIGETVDVSIAGTLVMSPVMRDRIDGGCGVITASDWQDLQPLLDLNPGGEKKPARGLGGLFDRMKDKLKTGGNAAPAQ